MLSDIPNMYFYLPLLGFVVAIIASLIGGGGGFIFFPVLTMIFGIDPRLSVSTSLIATLPIVLVGSIAHLKSKNINFKYALFFVVAGLGGVLCGKYLSTTISTDSLKCSFGVYTVFLGFSLLFKTYSYSANKSNVLKEGNHAIVMGMKNIMWGISAGAITGAFGNSGSTPIVSGLMQQKLPLKQIVGTSLLVVLCNVLLASASHIIGKNYDPTLILLLSIGSIPGAFIGSRWLVKKEIKGTGKKVQIIYALTMVCVGILMIK